ncbi:MULTISPECIES: MFS transporter [Elizabethkingia]|uniref:MFS transporter n=3 Tax=Elizabethkingia anophelis TaxID=1117645 RepID=A0A1T3DU67_9FLAO|nr:MULTISPECIES: MFS transporter [Elizabethkingia]AIL46145.1 putative multidrug resistance protein [Elizabethkingia anophelis NUHP1]AMR43167.1 MFS transporter [Elizabethkingia anophelis]AMX49808.1 MFS transporter [Elizabethkingia anophelis]AMX53197.1 MFS transporter [Elizabethkingia anophelis]AMX56659.1 MFS transporter [Elizabethkingia anophelis]
MLSIVMLINRSGSMVLPFLGVYMTDQLEFSIKESGIVLSFYGVGSVIGSWLGGYFTDKFGEYRVQSTSLFLSAPLFLLIPIFTSVEGMALIILLQSIISETFRPANSVAITKYARPENLTRAFSLNRMAINLGFSIGPALGGILSSVSYELLFITNAVGAILAGIFYVRFFRKRHKIYQKKMKEKSMVKDTLEKERSPYRDSPFLVYCLLCAIFSVCFFQFFNTIPIFYKEVAHLDQKSIGYILGYSGFIIVVLEMLVVNFADKYLTIAKTLLYGILMCAAAYAMLAINHHISLIMLSISILSVGEILVLPFMSTITALRSGKTNQGAYMGLNGMTFSISFIITPLLGTSVASDLGFNTLWIGSGAVLALAGIAMYFVVNWLLPGKVKAAH